MHQQLEEIVGNTSTIYIAFGVILLSILYYAFKNRGLPPGPAGIPYIGYWPFLKDETGHQQLHELVKKYGDVYSFTATGRLLIHFGSIRTIKEAHLTKSDYFANRFGDYNIMTDYFAGGVIFLQGEHWKVVRKFLVQQFRERGMTSIRETLSGPMYDTIRETVDDLRKTKGESVDIASALVKKCNKIMRQTLFGEDGMSERDMTEFNNAYSDMLKTSSPVSVLLFGPIAKYFIYPFTKGYSVGKECHNKMQKILYKAINNRKSTFDETHVRDVIDAFLNERMIRKSKNDPTAKYFTDKVLMVSLIQIVGDGVMFLALFIGDFIKALVDHPEEQEKIYNELVNVVGVDRDPTLEDKSRLPYTNAFISEVMRTSELFTLFPSLECSKETTIGGYRIPKGAITFYNFWAAHRNPKDYDEPDRFNPSRYIVKEGQKRPELPILFGIGKRSCIGEGFTMIQAFLYMTTIVKNFRLSKPTDAKDGNYLFFTADKLQVCAHPRSQS